MNDINSMVQRFAAPKDSPGCDKCGGRLELKKHPNPMGESAQYPEVLLIDCIHDTAECATLRKNRGFRPMGNDTPSLWVRHRFNWHGSGDPFEPIRVRALADEVRGLLDRIDWLALHPEAPAEWVTVSDLTGLMAGIGELADVLEGKVL